jgi:hypothetical protein
MKTAICGEHQAFPLPQVSGQQSRLAGDALHGCIVALQLDIVLRM